MSESSQSPVAAAFADSNGLSSGVADLDAIFARLESASDRSTRLAGLVELASWLRTSDASLGWPAGEADPARGHAAWRPVGVLTLVLERSPRAREIIATAIERAAAETDGLQLFAEAGVPNDRGLFDETSDRVARKLLPRPRDEQELAQLLIRAFPDVHACEWLEALDVDIALRFMRALDLSSEASSPWRATCEDALDLIATRIAALGSSEAARARRTSPPVRGSPYFELPRATDALLAVWRERGDDRAAFSHWKDTLEGVRAGCAEVLAALERRGVSIDLVYAVDAIEKLSQRSEALVDAIRPREHDGARWRALHALIVSLIRARLDDRSLLALARDNGRLLARKIVERSGRTGEHYIATSSKDHAALWGSAIVGGLITTFTAALKISIAASKLPLFVEGAFASCNYAASFVAIQLAHGTLATKQPAMTAATLAGILKHSGEARAEELSIHVVHIVRSQLAAALGNVTAVAIGAWTFDTVWRAIHGTPYLDQAAAEYVLHSLDPLATGTLFYAALTGVLLWVASLGAGAIGNASAYRRLPLAIADHRLGKIVGAERMQAVSRYFATNVSSFGGSIVLGILLGMTPIVGRFFGLPLDVRHVTLSTGQLALALTADGGTAWHDGSAVRAMAGIAAIFVLNLSVSFALALLVAARARSVRLRDVPGLVSAFLRRVARRPHELVWPTRPATS